MNSDLQEFLKNWRNSHSAPSISNSRQNPQYVILPLYSPRTGTVPQKSGLNQWNADGRARDRDEVYVPVPKFIHDKFPFFFPDTSFILELPNGERLSAKLCQQGKKGLMSNPNKDLGHWILRDVLKKRYGELVTMQDLEMQNIDSLKITKTNSNTFKVSPANNYAFYERSVTGL